MGRSLELTPAIRERICELYAIGCGYKRIQKRYPWISVSTVRCTVKKVPERRQGVSKPRSGQPKKLSEAQRDHILEAIHGHLRITCEDLLAEAEYRIKLPTMKLFLKDEGLRKWRASWRPLLNEQAAAKRPR